MSEGGGIRASCAWGEGPRRPVSAPTSGWLRPRRHENQELTALRFGLDAEGALVAGSVNDVFKELRGASAQ